MQRHREIEVAKNRYEERTETERADGQTERAHTHLVQRHLLQRVNDALVVFGAPPHELLGYTRHCRLIVLMKCAAYRTTQ